MNMFFCGLIVCMLAGEPDKNAVTHPYPGGDEGDLWLMAGQSNMGGYGQSAIAGNRGPARPLHHFGRAGHRRQMPRGRRV